MPTNTPLHELSEAQLNLLSPRMWDGEAEYELLSKSALKQPPGGSWPSASGIMRDFPFDFPSHKRQFLTTLLVRYKLFRQECTACGVPSLESHDSDEMIFVTQSTLRITRKHQRRLKSAPPDGPWETYSTIEWENIRTPYPSGYHLKYTEFNVSTSYPTCTVEQSQALPPDGWDGEDLTDLPDYEDYDWRITDEEERSDDSIISYADLVGACIAGLKDQVQAKQVVRIFSPRKAYPVNSFNVPLQGFAGPQDMTAGITGGEASAYQWTADLWATGQRIPFKLKYTQRIRWLYQNEAHDAGDIFSESEEELIFNHGSWHHELSPPLLVGRKTALDDAHIEIYNP